MYFSGDILAPSINGLDHLIRSPCGCGEQTMMFLAPNIYVIHYLKSTKQLSKDMKRKAVTNINTGTYFFLCDEITILDGKFGSPMSSNFITSS